MSLAGGWVLLFAGHVTEANRPAILKDPAETIAGIVWWTRGWLPDDRGHRQDLSRVRVPD
jgi:hypothetical protein